MKKIGIYTIVANNYGAQLQAYATVRFLKRNFPQCIIELVNTSKFDEKICLRSFIKSFVPSEFARKKKFRKFELLLPLTKNYTQNTLLCNPPVYDIYIVGSDQVWNVSETMQGHKVFFLPFHTAAPKIALASSFGTSFIPERFKKEVSESLNDFSSIAVREIDGVKILADLGIQSELILDPTFWLERKEWNKLAGNKPIIEGEYVVAMGFEISNQNPQKLMNVIKDLYKMPIIGLITYRGFHYDKKMNNLGPLEFLNVIKFSKLVITSSFHTLVFSLLFQKDFYLLKHTKRNSRMENLLQHVGLLNRMVEGSPDNYIDTLRTKEHIDYKEVELKLEQLQEHTRSYIKSAINRYL